MKIFHTLLLFLFLSPFIRAQEPAKPFLTTTVLKKYVSNTLCQKDFHSFGRCIRILEILKDPAHQLTFFLPKKTFTKIQPRLKKTFPISGMVGAKGGVWVSLNRKLTLKENSKLYFLWEKVWKLEFERSVNTQKLKLQFEPLFSESEKHLSLKNSETVQQAVLAALTQGFRYFYQDPHIFFETAQQLITRRNSLKIEKTKMLFDPKSVPSDIGVLSFKNFSSTLTCLLIGKKMEKIRNESPKPLTGWILDLRGNGGGNPEQARCIAGLFMGTGKPVYRFDYITWMDDLASTDFWFKQYRRSTGLAKSTSTGELRFSEHAAPLATEPLVVLIDENSASASEILAGVLQESNRAVLIGKRTFGKGCFQIIEEFDEIPGLNIRRTQGLYYLPSGRSPQDVGIFPDIQLGENTLETPEALLTPPSLQGISSANIPVSQLLTQKKIECIGVVKSDADPLDVAERTLYCF